MIVNQWLPAAHHGDAVGDSARALRKLFGAWGHQSEIFSMSIESGLEDEIRPWTDASARGGDITILHVAVPSDMSDAFGSLSGTRVIQYHNMTPAVFFARVDPPLARRLATGRQELAALADRTDLALAPSDFSRRELESLGFKRTGLLPLMIDTDRLRQAPAVPWLDDLLSDGLANILFVGRLAPNKRIDDHLRLVEFYKRYVDSNYRFLFVGRDDAVPAYAAAVRAMAREYQMPPERVCFTGPMSGAEVAACYRHAHAYVSLSDHEGFCVPLVEAMAMDVPILAYGATAVPETLGGAGVCFTPKDLEMAAEWLAELVYNESLRQQVLAGQRRRLMAFSRGAVEAGVKAVLDGLA